MFERILVPLDGSPLAEQALPIAARVARASQGSILLLRVVTPQDQRWEPLSVDKEEVFGSGVRTRGPWLEYGEHTQPPVFIGGSVEEPALEQAIPLAPEGDWQLVEAAIAEASGSLTITAKAANLAGLNVITRVMLGEPAEQILVAAEAQQADLIIMCSHGLTGRTRWALGSVTHKVVHHSPVPVLVLREKSAEPLSQGDAAHPLSALVALDGSSLAEAALQPAAHLVAALAAPGQGSLHLTRVVKTLLHAGEVGANTEKKAVLERANAYLETVAARLQETAQDSRISITWSVAIDTDVAQALISTAEDGERVEGVEGFRGCDLIAMSTSGRGFQHRWVMGSVSEHVLDASRLPVLILQPPDPSTRSSKEL